MAGVKFLDGTRRYGTMSFFFTSCRDSSFCAQQNGTVNLVFHGRAGRYMLYSRRKMTVHFLSKELDSLAGGSGQKQVYLVRLAPKTGTY